MAQAANVRSLEALREFRVALIKFIDKAKRAVSTSDSEVMRTQMWLDSHQPAHWKRELRKSEEQLNQAKSELFRATISQPDNRRRWIVAKYFTIINGLECAQCISQ